MSQQEGVQVLFTTHSANLVREIPINSLRYISFNENGQLDVYYGKNRADNTNNEAVIQKIIDSLGILPNPAEKVQVLLFVEGNNDVNALKRYSRILHIADPQIIDLSNSDKVGYVITGGSALKHYIEQNHLEGLGKPEVHIYDNDVPDYRRAVAIINGQKNTNKIAFNTTKLELENYLHHDAILEGYRSNGINDLNLNELTDTMDVPLYIAEKMNRRTNNNWDTLDEDKREELASDKKKFLNTIAVE